MEVVASLSMDLNSETEAPKNCGFIGLYLEFVSFFAINFGSRTNLSSPPFIISTGTRIVAKTLSDGNLPPKSL